MRVPADPDLTSEERLGMVKAVAEFNRGLYFECHETIENIWSLSRGPSRDFFQGLIQVSVGFHHLQRGNQTGALKMFAKALARLQPYPPRYLGFDVAGERRRLQDPMAEPNPTWRFENPPVENDSRNDPPPSSG